MLTTQSASEAIKELAEKTGNLTPELVLKEAKKKTSPLHSHFNWDDTQAAHSYRLLQASALIRKIKVEYSVSESKSVLVRAFHNVREGGDEGNERGVYVSVAEAFSVESYREQILAQCKRDMTAFRQKYAALDEVQRVIEVMQTFD